MSLSNRFFTNTPAVKNHEDTIESLHAQLTIARRETNPDQNKIASIKAKIRDLEILAAKNGNSVSIEFRTVGK